MYQAAASKNSAPPRQVLAISVCIHEWISVENDWLLINGKCWVQQANETFRRPSWLWENKCVSYRKAGARASQTTRQCCLRSIITIKWETIFVCWSTATFSSLFSLIYLELFRFWFEAMVCLVPSLDSFYTFAFHMKSEPIISLIFV